jgi:hypothetical protein
VWSKCFEKSFSGSPSADFKADYAAEAFTTSAGCKFQPDNLSNRNQCKQRAHMRVYSFTRGTAGNKAHTARHRLGHLGSRFGQKPKRKEPGVACPARDPCRDTDPFLLGVATPSGRRQASTALLRFNDEPLPPGRPGTMSRGLMLQTGGFSPQRVLVGHPDSRSCNNPGL